MGQLTRATFGAHLRQLREAAGLSQKIAARHAGVSEASWRRWEHGAIPQIWRAPAIAQALAISLPELLAPDPERIHVGYLTITPAALARIRKQGAPETARAAEDLAAQAARMLERAAAREPHQPPHQPAAHQRTPAAEVRARLRRQDRAQTLS